MKKKKISELDKPFICATLFYPDRNSTMCNLKLSELKGADVFELNLLPLKVNKEDLRDIFAFTEKPVFTTCRRSGPTIQGKKVTFKGSEEERMQCQLVAIKLGSSGFDMEFDTFHPNPNPNDQYTENETVTKKQKEIIQQAHELGGEVMISYHIYNKAFTAKEAVKIGKIIEERGADLAKIVCQNYNFEDTLETLRGVLALRKELEIPFCYFGMREHGKLTRVVGPMLGSMLVFATVTKIPVDFIWHQPLVEDMDFILKHSYWCMPPIEVRI